jgi:hypothetical protein
VADANSPGSILSLEEVQALGSVEEAITDVISDSRTTDPQWRPDQPDAFADPIGNIPWVQIHELLGTLPEGSTADFFNTNGTLN